MRDNFTLTVRKEIAQKAMYICANPDCLCLTGYTTTEGKARAIAEAAHINAASQNGPRATTIRDEKYLSSSENGIWLCKICHDKVDDDPVFYTEDHLKKWQKNHEERLRRIIGKDLERAILELRNERHYYDETREFISFLENRRVLYEGLDAEFPPRVLESLNMIRERITSTRAKINPETKLFSALNKLHDIICDFLRNIGHNTDLTKLRCDSFDDKWLNFSNQIRILRGDFIIIIKILSGDAGYTLSRW